MSWTDELAVALAQVHLHICRAGHFAPGLVPAAGRFGCDPVLALPPMLLGCPTQALLLLRLPLGLRCPHGQLLLLRRVVLHLGLEWVVILLAGGATI
jgi:hypothetical protein